MTSPAPSIVLFDLDDTLFAHRAAVARGILAHMSAIGGFDGVDSTAAVTLWNQLEEQHYHSYLSGEFDFEGQRRARARDFAAAHGIELAETASGLWFDSYFEHYRASWTLHDDALPCLDQLRAAIPGVRFGIITNGDPAFQQRKLDHVGLGDHMEHIVASGALGFTKPDARIFAHACELFGAPASEVVYVGDRLRTDAIGAADAGLLGVWLDRVGSELSTEDAAALTESGAQRIRSLAELAPTLLH